MTIIAKLLTAGLLTWFCLLALLIAVRMLRGDIRTSGFLTDRNMTGVAPERVVAMVAFPFVLLTYTMTALHADLSVVNGRPIGTLGSTAGTRGLAILRIDRVKDALDAGASIEAGGVPLSVAIPFWATFTFPEKTSSEEA